MLISRDRVYEKMLLRTDRIAFNVFLCTCLVPVLVKRLQYAVCYDVLFAVVIEIDGSFVTHPDCFGIGMIGGKGFVEFEFCGECPVFVPFFPACGVPVFPDGLG